jgi:phthalate 4,5-cis-dihydrodiol dehydrogenase
MLMRPTLSADPRVRLVAASDPRAAARTQFAAEFGGHAYADFAALCDDPDVEIIYIASPHQFHAEQAVMAAQAGKHVLVEKPMALSSQECAAMVAAADTAGVHLVVGPSHGFDKPVALARERIETGEHGAVRMITALTFTDFVYRPRRPEELDAEAGGGVVLNQGAHQIDVARRLAGNRIVSVRAQVGDWAQDRRTEGAYSAFLAFEGGATAVLVYSGYGHFDSDELCGWIGEDGFPKDPLAHPAARARLEASKDSEAALRESRTYGHGAADATPAAPFHEHFGFVLASCEHADLRITPHGLSIYGPRGQASLAVPATAAPRAAAIDELHDAIVNGRPALHDGRWGRATLEACLAIRESSRQGREISLG